MLTLGVRIQGKTHLSPNANINHQMLDDDHVRPYSYEKIGMNQTIEKRVPMSAQQRIVLQAAPVTHLHLMVISL
eukprot:scaffold13541_cov111-Skeletonema_marinoi.AAC.1